MSNMTSKSRVRMTSKMTLNLWHYHVISTSFLTYLWRKQWLLNDVILTSPSCLGQADCTNLNRIFRCRWIFLGNAMRHSWHTVSFSHSFRWLHALWKRVHIKLTCFANGDVLTPVNKQHFTIVWNFFREGFSGKFYENNISLKQEFIEKYMKALWKSIKNERVIRNIRTCADTCQQVTVPGLKGHEQ